VGADLIVVPWNLGRDRTAALEDSGAAR